MRTLIILISLIFISLTANASPSDFARKLCKEQSSLYKCIRIKIPRGSKRLYKEWTELFPEKKLRDIVISINRRNTLIWHNHIIAIPQDKDNLDSLTYAPFPLEKEWSGTDHIVIDLNVLAWAAYKSIPGSNTRARLAKWGPANGGIKRCKETKEMKCRTHSGVHYITKLHNAGKKSDLYPIECKNKKQCGHPMPYYMPFHSDGTGLHADKWLVGRNVSHGCVRMLIQDARWVNKHFASIGMKVLVEKY